MYYTGLLLVLSTKATNIHNRKTTNKQKNFTLASKALCV